MAIADAMAEPAAPLPPMVAAIVLNGRDTGEIIELIERDGGLFAQADDLRRIGLILPAGAAGPVRLDRLAHVRVSLDRATGIASIEADAGAVPASRLGAGASPAVLAGASAGTALVLDYDLDVEGEGTATPTIQGAFDARLSRGPWVAETTMTARLTNDPEYRRLETSVTYSDPVSLRRYRVGDVISGGLDWTRPVRMGGVQLQSDFSLRPDLVTYPVPHASGTAAVPTTVSVLVDGVERLSQQTPQGPFEIPRLPVMSGANQVSVVTQDSLGRQVVQQLAFYASPSLLAEGLSSLSAEAGLIRRNFGSSSDRYGMPAASATLRRGLADWITGEAHGEFAERLANAGIGGAFTLGSWATASVAAAGSVGGGSAGALVSAGIERVTRGVSLGVSVQRASDGYRDLAAINGEPTPASLVRARIGGRIGGWGSFGASYAAAGSATRLVSLSWSGSLGAALRAFATGYHDLAGRAGTGATLSMSLRFGGRTTATASGILSDGRAGGTIQVARSLDGVDTLGWRAALTQDGAATRGFGEVRYRSGIGEFGAGIDQGYGITRFRATATGAVVVAQGGVFAANTIDDSFAVIDADQPGVDVFLENRLVGTTDSEGRLLAPMLRAYQTNRLSIDAAGLGLGMTIDTVAQTVVPPARAGVVVRFPIRVVHAATMILVDANGAALPVGSTVAVRGTDLATSVGYGGEVYLEGLAALNLLDVTVADTGRHCTARADYPVGQPDLPRLGALVCQETPP
ncbi:MULTISPECIES: fimbria/pilus outer membrane usher protein [unclassified Sphingomonas]|uniref:fimbria/pilus outer membrane usher protein n=1 Tax=unclassified Sphingomonas TaxID=196159 RepID=UPI00226AA7D5|nr:MULTISPECIES: fimbria/pilus outer membrane usher protein [unclassified Sphingomonas]